MWLPPSDPAGMVASLVPLIRSYTIDDSKGLLRISGPIDQNWTDVQVSVGGHDQAITEKRTDSATITCTLPPSGDGSSGDVVVTINGHRSGRARITSWRGTATYTLTGPGDRLKIEVQMNLHLRGDLVDTRIESGGVPVPGGKMVQMANDSSATYVCTGDYDDGRNKMTWAGSGTVPSIMNVPPGRYDYFSVDGGSTNQDVTHLNWNFQLGAPNALEIKHYIWNSADRKWDLDYTSNEYIHLPWDGFITGIGASLAPDGTIGAGKTPPSPADDLPNSYHWPFTQQFSWDTMVPEPGTGLDDKLER